ncbi:hypothetical protein ACT7DH_04625 [Bacillus pacificus]
MYGDSALAVVKEILLYERSGVQKAADNGICKEVDENNVMKDNGLQSKLKMYCMINLK